jgi:hypothetical protein
VVLALPRRWRQLVCRNAVTIPEGAPREVANFLKRSRALISAGVTPGELARS